MGTRKSKKPLKLATEKTTRLGVAIRLYLASKNLTQKQFAIAAGVKEETLSRFLTGDNQPSAQTLMRVMDLMLEPDQPNEPEQPKKNNEDDSAALSPELTELAARAQLARTLREKRSADVDKRLPISYH